LTQLNSSYLAVVTIDAAQFPTSGCINTTYFANEQVSTVKMTESRFDLSIVALKGEENISK
jgi:hypothetical protein